MSCYVSPNLKAVALAAGLDIDRYYRDNIRPVNENPADAPDDPYWPELSDLDAEAGCKQAEELRCEPTKNRVIDGVQFQGWKLADGFWIGRCRATTSVDTSWSYCRGQAWDDIWQG